MRAPTTLLAALLATFPVAGAATRQSLDLTLGSEDVETLRRAGALTVLGTAPRTHGKRAEAIDWSPDGSTILTIGEEGSLTLWDAATGAARTRTRITNAADTEGALAACFDADGRIVASWSDRVVRVHDAGTMDVVQEIEGVLPAGRLLPSADRTFFAKEPYYIPFLAEEDPVAQAFGLDARSVGSPIEIEGGFVYDVAVSNGGGRVAFVGLDDDGERVLGVQDADGEPVAAEALATFLETGEEFLTEVLDLDLSPDGKLLALGGFGSVVLFDLDRGKVSETIEASGYRTSVVRFSPDGKLLFVGDTIGNLTGIRLRRSGAKVLFTERLHGGSTRDIAVDPSGDRVATIEGSGVLRVFDVKAARLLLESDGPRGAISAVAFHPGGDELLLGALDGGMWRAAGDAPLERPEHPVGPPLLKIVTRGPDRVVSVDSEGVALLGRLGAGDGGRVPGPDVLVTAADGSADGVTWVYGDVEGGVTVQRSGSTVSESAFDDTIVGVALAPDGERFAAIVGDHVFVGSPGSDAVTRLTSDVDEDDVQPTPLLVAFAGKDEVAIVFDDEVLAVVGVDGTEVRRIALLPELAFYGGGLAAAFSADARRVATFTDKTGLRVHDVRTGQLIASVVLDAPPAASLAFSPDGDRVAVGGASGQARVFDLPLLESWAAGDLRVIDPMVPAESVRARAWGHHRIASSARVLGRVDAESYHLERAMALSAYLPAAERGPIQLVIALELTEAGVLTRERRILVASIAEEWIKLARVYDRKKEADLARYCLDRALRWDSKPARAAHVELFGAPPAAPVGETAAGEGDAALPELAFFPSADGGQWDVASATSVVVRRNPDSNHGWTRRAVATEPLADAHIQASIALDVRQRANAGVLVGIPEAGWGGFGVYVLVDPQARQLQFWIEDAASRRRLNQRRYTLDPKDVKRTWDLDVKVEGKDLVAQLGTTRTLRVGAEKPIRGLYGFQIEGIPGLGMPVEITDIVVTPGPRAVPARPRKGDAVASGSASEAAIVPPEPSFEDRLDGLLVALADGGASDEPGGVVGQLLNLAVEAERLSDPAARALVRQRIDDALTERDPLLKRRMKALSRISELCLEHADLALEKGFPMTALAWRKTAASIDRDVDVEAPGLESAVRLAAGILPSSGTEAARPVPDFAKSFGASESVAAGEWQVVGEAATTSPDASTVAMLYSAGKKLGSTFEIATDVKVGRNGVAGLFFDHSGPSGAFSVVGITRYAWTVRIDLYTYDGKAWKEVTRFRVAAGPGALEDWTPLRVALRDNVLTMEAGGCEPIEIPFTPLRKQGGFGIYASSRAGVSRVSFRDVSVR